MAICDVCGLNFKTKAKRSRRPQKYCSPECRKIYNREYMRDYMRDRRRKHNELLRSVHGDAHREMSDKGLNEVKIINGHYVQGIDSTHNKVDFIPAYSILEKKDGKLVSKKIPAYKSIGTISDRDLSLIKVDGKLRVKGAIDLKNKKVN